MFHRTPVELDNISMREAMPLDGDDMIAYVSVTGFVAMLMILFIVLSL